MSDGRETIANPLVEERIEAGTRTIARPPSVIGR